MSGRRPDRRLRTLVVLVGLLAAARLGVWLGERPPAAVGLPVLSFAPAQVARVRLARGQDEVVLQRAPGSEGETPRWILASHGGLPAREGAVEDLLERLASWRVERVAGADPARHEEWFVSEGRARRVTLEAAGGQPVGSLWVGKVTGVDPEAARVGKAAVDVADLGVFVRAAAGAVAPSEQVVVVNAFVTRQLDPRLREWLPRPLVGGSPDEVTRLTVRPAGAPPFAVRFLPPPARFEAAGAGSVPAAPLDPTAARALVTQLFLLDAVAAAPSGPVPATATRVTVEHPAGRRDLALWRAGESWVLQRDDGLRVSVSPSLAAAVAEARAETLGRRRLLPLAAAHVIRLHWIEAHEELALARTDAGWDAVVTGGRRPLRHRVLSRAEGLESGERVTALEASRWSPLAAATPQRGPRLEVVVRGGERWTIAFGPRRPDGWREARVTGLEDFTPEVQDSVVRALRDALWQRVREAD